jgi:outer membrane protein assembly factor BamB
LQATIRVPIGAAVTGFARERRGRSDVLGQADTKENIMKQIAALFFSCVFCATLSAGNWPAWRGPTGQGICAEKNIPLQWSDTKNVKWKIELKHQANSTPIIWGDRIFLTQANTGGSVRSLLCFARANGKLLWQKDVTFDGKERNWNQKWYCNASPVTDGKRVVVSFGSAGMYCYDTSGKQLWKRDDLGTWQHPFGNASSPVLYGNLAILWCGPDEGKNNRLLAVNNETGKTVWETPQDFGSWSTPVIATVKGEDQLILGYSRDIKNAPESKNSFLRGFDLKKGKEIWRCRGLDSFVYTSALVHDDIAVALCGFGGSALAVKLGGTGDITGDRLWRQPRPSNQRIGSGVIVGAHFYLVEENGTPHCYELKTGKEVWKAPRERNPVTWGSMIHADGRLYVLMRNGETRVYAAEPTYKVLATNSLGQGEETNSSPVISNGEIYLRTFKHLWCISAKK